MRDPSQVAPAVASHILAIIVLYKQLPSESPSLQTLLRAARHPGATHSSSVSVLLADNTPGGQHPGVLPASVRYRAYPHNPGLAGPYNDALAIAEAEGIPWVLTLDQDTHLPSDFFLRLRPYLDSVGAQPVIAAIVPRVLDGNRQVSPFRFLGGFLPRMLPPSADGIAPPHTSAINSAAFHRTAALRALGGFDLRFPLHNSDTNFFQKVDRAKMHLVVARDVIVQHEFSMLERSGRMTPERYRQNLVDECRFWDLQMPFVGRAERLLRLVLRAVKGQFSGEARGIQLVTLQEIRRRLLTSRSQRLQRPTGS